MFGKSYDLKDAVHYHDGAFPPETFDYERLLGPLEEAAASRPELAGTSAANLPGMPHKAAARPGRNDPCTCGSGRKYKRSFDRN